MKIVLFVLTMLPLATTGRAQEVDPNAAYIVEPSSGSIIAPSPLIEIGSDPPRLVTIVDAEAIHRCDLQKLARAVKAIVPLLSKSTDPVMGDLLYRTPAASLRESAEQMERLDAAIEELRDQNERCGWMAEEGVFDQ